MNKKALMLTFALALPVSVTTAQEPGDRPPGKRPPRDGERGRPDKPRNPPLIHALDADHDGIISAEEIKRAPDALAKLDRNKDGKLTAEELWPHHPDGPPRGEREDGGKPKTRNNNSERNRPPEPFPGQKAPRDGEERNARPKDGEQPKDGPRDHGDKPQRPPLFSALDADGNGVISADEIEGAAKALLGLDRNEDGQLGPVEYMGRPRNELRDEDGPRPPRPPEEDQ